MVWYGMVWYGMVWYEMIWCGMAWYGMVWYGMVWCLRQSKTSLTHALLQKQNYNENAHLLPHSSRPPAAGSIVVVPAGHVVQFVFIRPEE